MTAMASEGGWVRIQPRLCKPADMSKGNGTYLKAESGAMERYRWAIRHMPNTKPQPQITLGKANTKNCKTMA
jgi:hypothetical protein